MDNYLENQRDHVFRNVAVLIYVFDIESRDAATDMKYYRRCMILLGWLRVFSVIKDVFFGGKLKGCCRY